METVYLNKNPTAKSILDLVRSADGDQICYDHFAYRTFGVKFNYANKFVSYHFGLLLILNFDL